MADPLPRASEHVARKRAARTRRAIEEAARVFAERGYDGAGFEEIAGRLGLRGPSLYHYFPSKEDMFLACVEHGAGEVMQRLRAIAARPEPAADRLRQMFAEQVLIQTRDYPAFVPLFLRTYVPVPRIQVRVAELKRAQGDVIREVAAQCAAEAGLGADQARVALMAAFGALAYLGEWYSPDGPMSPEALAAALSATLVAPFLPPAPGARAGAPDRIRPGERGRKRRAEQKI